MSADALVTFEDIYTAICRKIKIQLSDGATVERIKQDINLIYLNEVVPFKPRAWTWLHKRQYIKSYEREGVGTASVVKGSTTVSFSENITNSLAGYYFKLTGKSEIIKITAHTAGTNTATLEVSWPIADMTDVGWKAWRDNVSLNSDCKEVIQITHDRRPTPLEARNSAQMWEIRQRMPEADGYPVMYTSNEFDDNGNVVVKWFPSSYEEQVLMNVLYAKEAPKLDLDDDEPLMPVEDRIVLFYGALSLAWARERNESESAKSWNMFQMKLNRMAAKSGDAPQTTEMYVDPDYLIRTRYRRLVRSGRRRWEQR